MSSQMSRAQMDEFSRRLNGLEKKQEALHLSLEKHLSSCEGLQKVSNIKMNFVLCMLLIVVVMTMLGPHDGILHMLNTIK